MKKSTLITSGIIILAVIAIGIFALSHKSPNKYVNSSNASSNNPYNSTPQPTPSPSAATSASIVQTKNGPGGQYLADANGNALYTYGGDTNGVSNCNGSCLTYWPIYKATTTTSLPTNVTVIKRSDGSLQYAYKGMALYTFSSDSPGQVTGDGVSNFHLARP